jgi:hypothetical protein
MVSGPRTARYAAVVAPRPSPGRPDDDGFLANLRRALFMRQLRHAQEEQSLPGTAPHLNFRQRRLIRAMLAHPDRPWSLNAIWYAFLIMPDTMRELGEDLSAAGLANIRWIEGTRSLELTDYGVSEFPQILDLYRSQRPLIVLFQSGPRSAGILWWMRHRDRVWRRGQKSAHKNELPAGGSDENGDDDSKLLW